MEKESIYVQRLRNIARTLEENGFTISAEHAYRCADRMKMMEQLLVEKREMFDESEVG